MTDIATLRIAVDSTGVTGADKAMQSMGKTGQWLEGILKATMAALATYKITEFIKESATLAARYETLGVVMGVVGNNAGYTAQQMENYARALQDTGISMVESRNTLAIMAQAHIDLARATDLAREAQDAAVIGNINSSEAFQRMIYGIQSGQTDVLRTIGINVNFEASYAKVAAQLGKTTKNLTENEKATARMNAVLEKGPDLAGAYAASMETPGKQLLSMKRYAEDFATSAGNLFGDAMKVGVQNVNSALKDMKRWLDENAVAAAVVKQNLGGAASNFVGMVEDITHAERATDKLVYDLSLMEILSGGVGLTFSFIRDMANLSLGYMESVVGVFTYLPAKIVEGIAWIVGVVPDWLKNLADAPDRLVSDGVGRLGKGFKNTIGFYSGAQEASGAAYAANYGDQGYKREPRNAERILEQQRMRGVRGAGAGGGGGAGSVSDTKALYAQEQKDLAAFLQEQYDLNYEAQEINRKLATEEYLQQQQDAVDAMEHAKQLATERSEWELQQAQKHADDLKRVHTDLFGDMGSTLEGWSQRSANAFTEFCMTGKLSFTSLINSMIEDLIRLIAEQQMLKVFGTGTGTTGIAGWINSMFGTSSGASSLMMSGSIGSGSSTGDIIQLASGTDYVPHDGLAYIHKGEAVTPAKENKARTVHSNTTVNVYNNNGQTEAKVSSSGGAALGRAIEAKVLEVIQNESRPGGCLNPV